MRAKLGGHEYTYCHHSMSEPAQKLGEFIVENDISTEALFELLEGMLSDAAFSWRDEFYERAVRVEEAVLMLGASFKELLETISSVEDRRTIPRTKEGWKEWLLKHVANNRGCMKGWDLHAFKPKDQ